MTTLVIGCSFSQGSYYPKYDKRKDTKEIYLRDSVHTVKGWYNFLGLDNLIVYGLGSYGYVGYSEIFKTIDLSNINQCIIQETFEPRIYFVKDLKLKKKKLGNMTHFTGRGLKNVIHSVPLPSIINSVSAKHIPSVCKCYMENILEKRNVPCYTISYREEINGTGYSKHLCSNLYEQVIRQKDPSLFSFDFKHNIDPWPHLSLNGNEFVGNYVKSMLDGQN